MVEFIITFLVSFIFGYLVGQRVLLWYVRENLKKSDGRFNVGEPKIKVAQLNVEQVGDILYMYDIESNHFICQAKTIEELAAISKIKYASVRYGDSIFVIIDGVVKPFTL